MKPIILTEGEYDDVKLDNFLDKNKTWEVRDVYLDQLAELFEIQNPSLIGKNNFEDLRTEYLDQFQVNHRLFGNWIYYPWSGIVVHAVSEHEYFELRTNRNKDLITYEEQKILYESRIAIAGLSIGSSLVTSLVHSGIGHYLTLAEHDNLETTNLNRVQQGVDKIGKSKLELTMQKLFEIDPYINISSLEEGLKTMNVKVFLSNEPRPSVVVDAIDDFSMKLKLRIAAKDARIPVLMFSNLGDSIMIDIERYDLNKNTPLFNGRVKKNVITEIIQHPDVTQREKNQYAIKLVGKNYIPKKALTSVEQIGHSLVARPQLMSTVITSSGIATYLIRNVILQMQGISSGRFLMKFSELLKGMND